MEENKIIYLFYLIIYRITRKADNMDYTQTHTQYTPLPPNFIYIPIDKLVKPRII